MPEPAVSIEQLSRLIDGELSTEEAAAVESSLAGCPTSRRLLAGLREIHTELAAAIVQNPLLENDATSVDCLDADTLMLLAEGKLSPAEMEKAEEHAAGCPRCLRQLLLEMRSHTSMKAAHWRELPPEVTEHPRLRGMPHHPKPQETKGYEKIKPLHKDAGASVLPEGGELHLTGQIRHSLTGRTTTQQSFQSGEFSLSVQLRDSGNTSANLEILVQREKKPLWETEIIVAEPQVDRKIFRGLTSRDGRVLVRKLKVGSYEIQLPAAALRVTLAIIT